jgi:hypothetical protein
MKAKIGVGAEIDFLTNAELKAELEEFRKFLVDDLKRSSLRVRRLEESGVIAADGTLTITTLAPVLGKAWDVRRITVTGQDPAVALAGTVVIFRGNASTPTNFVDRTTALPDVSTWSSHQFTLTNDEPIIFKLTGGVAGTSVFVSVQVIEGKEADVIRKGED